MKPRRPVFINQIKAGQRFVILEPEECSGYYVADEDARQHFGGEYVSIKCRDVAGGDYANKYDFTISVNTKVLI